MTTSWRTSPVWRLCSVWRSSRWRTTFTSLWGSWPRRSFKRLLVVFYSVTNPNTVCGVFLLPIRSVITTSWWFCCPVWWLLMAKMCLRLRPTCASSTQKTWGPGWASAQISQHSDERVAALCWNEISCRASALLWWPLTDASSRRQHSSEQQGFPPRWKLSSSFQIIAVWEKNFRLPDPVTAEKMASLEKSFVNMARHRVKFGPSSVSDFTKWRVKSFTLSAPPDSVLQLSVPWRFGWFVALISGWDSGQGISPVPDGADGGSRGHGGNGGPCKTLLNEAALGTWVMWSTVLRVDVWWFFQAVSTPSKRKQTSPLTGSVTLSPHKKLKTGQEPAEDGCCTRLLRLRPQTPGQTCEVRVSPCKSGPPPNTPTRQLRMAPRGKESPARQVKEGGAKLTQEVLPAVKNRKTQVMLIKPIKQYRLVKNDEKFWWLEFPSLFRCVWGLSTSCSVTASWTVVRTSPPSCGPAPSSHSRARLVLTRSHPRGVAASLPLSDDVNWVCFQALWWPRAAETLSASSTVSLGWWWRNTKLLERFVVFLLNADLIHCFVPKSN